jgi:hypothetical protein
VKRSQTIQLVLLVSSAATLESCVRDQCVDERGIVVDNKYCQNLATGTGHGYRYYNPGFWGSSQPVGSSVYGDSGTVRGVLGGAGESAHGGEGGHGGGGE